MTKLQSFLILLILLPVFAGAGTAIVAKVNGAAISKVELEAEVNRLIPQSTYHGNVSEETKAGLREKALENLIVRELQYQDAVARGVKPEKSDVKKQLAAIRDRYHSKKDYKAALEQAGLNEDTLRAEVEKYLQVQTVIARTVQEPSVYTEAAVKEYYEKNQARFIEPESLRISLISAKEESKARQALKQIRAGEDFGNVASRMSEDNYRIKGGDIGYIHRGRVVQEVEDVAFRLKKGEMSDLIKGNGTWFIIRVEDKRPEHQKSFEEMKGKLKKDLEAKKGKELMEAWVAQLRSKARIEIAAGGKTKENK